MWTDILNISLSELQWFIIFAASTMATLKSQTAYVSLAD